MDPWEESSAATESIGGSQQPIDAVEWLPPSLGVTGTSTGVVSVMQHKGRRFRRRRALHEMNAGRVAFRSGQAKAEVARLLIRQETMQKSVGELSRELEDRESALKDAQSQLSLLKGEASSSGHR